MNVVHPSSTEAATAATAPPEAAELAGPVTEQPPENGGERDESGRYLSREAASYRRRLRNA